MKGLTLWFLSLNLLVGSQLGYGFDGKFALKQVQVQMDMGPRYLTSPGHVKLQEWLKKSLHRPEVKLGIDHFAYLDAHHQTYQIRTLVFRYHPERTRRLLLGAHYDTRRYADKDPEDPLAIMPGANDGASGVAVLVSLAPQLPGLLQHKDFGVDLVFFDAEEGELDPEARPWRPIGSIHFAQNLKRFYPKAPPELAVVVDMVCDRDLQLKLEQNSLHSGAATQAWTLWKIGRSHHPGFISQVGYSVYDDHFPLIQKGIPSILLIDFDYPAWHTQKDLIDQCSAKSLQAVGQTLEDFLGQY